MSENRPCDRARPQGLGKPGAQKGCTSRREFLKLAGASAALLAGTRPLRAGQQAGALSADHFVPVDKPLDPKWIKSLFERGRSTFYAGRDLETIAMPVGGICAGQVYLSGDGRLMHWDIFNERHFTGYGRDNYLPRRLPTSPLAQGFALRIAEPGSENSPVSANGNQVYELRRDGFPQVRFCGEFPLGRVEYEAEQSPVSVCLEAFSPFIPLNAPDSALPAVVLSYTLRNKTDRTLEVTLAGWLENRVNHHSGTDMAGVRVNRVVRRRGLTMVTGSARAVPAPQAREPIVLADFEGKDYGNWQAEGKAFGSGPAKGTLPAQQPVSGFLGQGLANTYLGGDDELTGRLVSPKFTIERRFISFLVGGGGHAGRTCVNLLSRGKRVRTATGNNDEKLHWHNWNVEDLEGQEVQIEIVDEETSGWGHINVDQIEQRDTPRSTRSGPLEAQSDFGTMALAVLDAGEDVMACAALPQAAAEQPAESLFGAGGLSAVDVSSAAQTTGAARAADAAAEQSAERPFGAKLLGAVGKRLKLAPGAEQQVHFLVTWCFPNRPERGNYYATRFGHAGAVASYVAENFARLDGQTRLWHHTWYDSTLPRWLLDRLFSTVSTLATSTCQWWANGRFWAWEGVGCCHGTCTHVWNYEHAMARLFPELERSVREMQDYEPSAGFDARTGMIRFRGEDWKRWAGDGQAGSVLKALREHQMSADDGFLRRLWPRVRKSLEFLMAEDAQDAPQSHGAPQSSAAPDGPGAGPAADGILEGRQHNTYDIDFFGPNTMVGSLYLAALRAAEQMARELGDQEFAERCARLFEAGSRFSAEHLFNGEYFVQRVDLEQHPKAQYADGCLADQLFGQGWAHQVGLGDVYPPEMARSALEAIWKYNWAPDTGPQNKAHAPERWFSEPGEAGLFTCTWPMSPHLDQGVRYKNEVWTGIEYQVAGHMAWEGMVTEALAVCRAIHERYHPAKRNPFNEIECGDHYARAMASYGVFLALCGFEYHGPQGRLGLSPRWQADDFRGAFTAAEGWGTLSQRRQPGKQTNAIQVHFGRVRLGQLALELPEGAALREAVLRVAPQTGGGTAGEAGRGPRRLGVRSEQEGRRVVLTLTEPVVAGEGEELEVEIIWDA